MYYLVNISVGTSYDEQAKFVTDRCGAMFLWDKLARSYAESYGHCTVQMHVQANGAPIDPRTGTLFEDAYGVALRILPAKRIPEDLLPEKRTVVVGAAKVERADIAGTEEHARLQFVFDGGKGRVL